MNPASLGLIPEAKSESDACRKFYHRDASDNKCSSTH